MRWLLALLAALALGQAAWAQSAPALIDFNHVPPLGTANNNQCPYTAAPITATGLATLSGGLISHFATGNEGANFYRSVSGAVLSATGEWCQQSSGFSPSITITIDPSYAATLVSVEIQNLLSPATGGDGSETYNFTAHDRNGAVLSQGHALLSAGGAIISDNKMDQNIGKVVITPALSHGSGVWNYVVTQVALNQTLSPVPGPHDGIYQITNADGSAGDYVSVHSRNGNMLATVYRSSRPANGSSFTLSGGGAGTALYVWGSWDLYSGTTSGNSATLSGYSQYGLCKANVSLSFGASNSIRIAPAGLSDLAPPGAQASACGGSATTLAMQQIWADWSSAYPGVYQITNADGSAGDYVSVHHNAADALLVTVYRSVAPAGGQQSFDLMDGGARVATLTRWGSWDLYNGTAPSDSYLVGFTGYTQYGLCKGTGTIDFDYPYTIRIAPSGASEFAPAGSHPSCSGAGTGTLTLTRVL